MVIEGCGGGEGGGGGSFGEAGTTKASEADLESAIAAMLEDGFSPSEASKRAVLQLRARRKEAYAIALRLAGKQ